jgi:hypothetical protein
MPKIRNKKLGVALDMRGCPNRCRHCYLGFGTNQKMAGADLLDLYRARYCEDKNG